MLTDTNLSFNTSWATTQLITTTADSSSVIDITGAGVGNAPAMINGFPALNTAIGVDDAYGQGVAGAWVMICVKASGGNNANTLTVSLKSAPDSGTYTEGTYTTCGSTGAMLDSSLVAGTLIAFPMPPIALGAALPRFYKLTYTASATLTPLGVSAGIVINPPTLLLPKLYPSNFIAV